MNDQSCNVLFTSVGRRVVLLRIFKKELGKDGLVFGTDCDPTAPGLYVADKGFVAPKVTEADYIPFLLHICKEEKVKLVIPLIDPELPLLAEAREKFLELGIVPLVSSYDAVMTGYDKLRTAYFFAEHGIPAPKTIPFERSLYIPPEDFPVVVKPRFGSASIGVHKCSDMEEVRFYAARIPQPIVQQFMKGEEITVDVLCDFQGNLLSMVQRKRLKVRAGEVERGVTIKDERVFELTRRITSVLRPYGVINIQYFITQEGVFCTEINPRFGGGYPLSYYAGANFPRGIIALLKGDTPEHSILDYQEGLFMLRYDEALYIGRENMIPGSRDRGN